MNHSRNLSSSHACRPVLHNHLSLAFDAVLVLVVVLRWWLEYVLCAARAQAHNRSEQAASSALCYPGICDSYFG
ncbi:unnamed protein product [Colias eurytheme]|nr:unnamed protein product [Colias eurytheme]